MVRESTLIRLPVYIDDKTWALVGSKWVTATRRCNSCESLMQGTRSIAERMVPVFTTTTSEDMEYKSDQNEIVMITSNSLPVSGGTGFLRIASPKS